MPRPNEMMPHERPPHEEIFERLDRLEETMVRIEEKLIQSQNKNP